MKQEAEKLFKASHSFSPRLVARKNSASQPADKAPTPATPSGALSGTDSPASTPDAGPPASPLPLGVTPVEKGSMWSWGATGPATSALGTAIGPCAPHPKGGPQGASTPGSVGTQGGSPPSVETPSGHRTGPPTGPVPRSQTVLSEAVSRLYPSEDKRKAEALKKKGKEDELYGHAFSPKVPPQPS